MIALGWTLTAIAMFLLGYHYRTIVDAVRALPKAIDSKVDKEPVTEEPKSELIDPTDEVQTAKYEHDQLMKKLNP